MKQIFLLSFIVLCLGCGRGTIVFEETQVKSEEYPSGESEEYPSEEIETTAPVVTDNNCVTDIVNLPCGIYCIQIGERVIWFEIKSEDFGPQFYPGGDPRLEPRF
ncbi:MAG: hypothetical protein HYW47_07070 [Deltaproteobacteria bacterium]|nr:hypothetical protein [Deltaproteobacteria bacterium]